MARPGIDVLLIDDWPMTPLYETERRDFWEICEDRYQTRSLIVTSQGQECDSRHLSEGNPVLLLA